MWYIVLVLLTSVEGIDPVTVLNPDHPFREEAECLAERDRIGFAMAEAYPEENDFLIACYKLREVPPETRKSLT